MSTLAEVVACGPETWRLGRMLYLARHGETIWNLARRFQGSKDSPLTERGRAQAHNLGRLLSRLVDPTAGPLTTYVSPLGRAQETASIIGQHLELDRRSEPRIAEVVMGDWDGMTDYEIECEYPGARDGCDRFDWYFRGPGGESLEAIKRRLADWQGEALRPALVVSHGVAGRIIRGLHLELSDAEMLRAPVPQNGLYRLTAGKAEFVEAVADA